MDTDKIIQSRLNAVDDSLKQIFETVLELYAEKKFISYLLLLKEDEELEKQIIHTDQCNTGVFPTFNYPPWEFYFAIYQIQYLYYVKLF